MKKLIISIIFCISLITAQDAAGNYKLSGLDVQYYMAARYDTPIIVSDTYGAGISLAISQIGAGQIFYEVHNAPLSEASLASLNINLNINLNEDGTGEIAEGSFYPDQELGKGCISGIQILPITDDLLYQSNGALSLTNSGVNVVGIPSISQYAGQTFGGLGLSQSVVFDYFPMIPEQPPLCDGLGNCFNIVYPGGSLDGFNTCVGGGGDAATCAAEHNVLPAGAPMPGFQAGFFWKEGVNGPDDIKSIIPGNTDPQFYLEWHAMDGAASGRGLGDIIGKDEDGDGTDFDRILGLPYITATHTNPACGFNHPIFGDVTAYLPSGCATAVDVANDAYVMDPSLATWGGFLTYNAAIFSQTAGTLTDIESDPAGIMADCGATGTPTNASAIECLTACSGDADCTLGCVEDCAASLVLTHVMTDTNINHILLDDSDHDFDGTDGRMVMNFAPTCIPEIEIREVVVEFIDREMSTVASAPIQKKFELSKPYPNPFNPVATISFTIPNSGQVNIKIFDITGRELTVLINERMHAGINAVKWDASDYPSGVYLVRMESGNFTKTQKLILMK